MAERAQARKLGDLVEALFAEPGLASWMSLRPVRERWVEVVGESVGQHTRILTLERGVLRIEVDSPPLMAELATFRKAEVLARLREALPSRNVRDLRFMPGSWRVRPDERRGGGEVRRREGR